MNCPFCQREFDETRLPEACKACPSGGGCRHVRCPYCGYEMPREPGLVKHLRNLFRKPAKGAPHEQP